MDVLIDGLTADPSVDIILVTENNNFWIDCVLKSLIIREYFDSFFCAGSKYDDEWASHNFGLRSTNRLPKQCE